MSERECEGLVAIVTGGCSGIGLATAQLLERRGASVAVLDPSPLPEGSTFLHIEVDVTDEGAVEDAISAVVEQFGGLDILVNNAGIGAQGTVETNSTDEWKHVFDVNVFGAVRVSRAALPFLRRSKSAAIVNLSSIAATAGLPLRALYSATKGAMLSLTLAMAADHVAEGIRVNAVNPGTTDTPWVQRLLSTADDPEHERVALAARQPTGHLVDAEHVAEAVVFLAGPRSLSTTGTSFAVDGGMAGLRVRPRSDG